MKHRSGEYCYSRVPMAGCSYENSFKPSQLCLLFDIIDQHAISLALIFVILATNSNDQLYTLSQHISMMMTKGKDSMLTYVLVMIPLT